MHSLAIFQHHPKTNFLDECLDWGAMVFLCELICVSGLYNFHKFPAVSLGQMEKKMYIFLRTQEQNQFDS